LCFIGKGKKKKEKKKRNEKQNEDVMELVLFNKLLSSVSAGLHMYTKSQVTCSLILKLYFALWLNIKLFVNCHPSIVKNPTLEP
jgi:hypothetical protein